MTDPLPPLYSTAAGARLDKVLGKAVHPKAKERLLELWPEAEVEVEYHRSPLLTTTTVGIRDPSAPSGSVLRWAVGVAVCAEGDQFERKVGIRLAFKRALLKVKEATEGGPR